MAQRRALIENQAVAKHVESLPIPYLDESSNLSGSTMNEKGLAHKASLFCFAAERWKRSFQKQRCETKNKQK